MKRISVVLLLLGLAGCKYPSRSQADKACGDWYKVVTISSYAQQVDSIKRPDREKVLEKRLKENMEEDYPHLSLEEVIAKRYEMESLIISGYQALKRDDKRKWEIIDHRLKARWCIEEEETNQILGYENKAVLNGTWQNIRGKTGEGKIIKHFRY